MLNIRGMSTLENLLTGVNRFGHGLTKLAELLVTVHTVGRKLYEKQDRILLYQIPRYLAQEKSRGVGLPIYLPHKFRH